MPRVRKSMRKIREVLRLGLGLGLSQRKVARSAGLGHGTVWEYLLRAKAAGLSSEQAERLDGAELERRLFPSETTPVASSKASPFWAEVHQELRRRTPQCVDHRPDWRWQDLPGVCLGTQGPSRRLHGAVPEDAAVVPRPADRSWRYQLRAAPEVLRTHRPDHPGRLGSGVDRRGRAARDLLEILEDRYGRCSTLVTSQLPVDKWKDVIGAPTLADGILDRLIHDAYTLTMKGESMRRKRARPYKSSSEDEVSRT